MTGQVSNYMNTNLNYKSSVQSGVYQGSNYIEVNNLLIDKIILSLLSKNMGPKDISFHLNSIYSINITPQEVMNRLIEYLPKIEHINSKLNEFASDKVEYIEIDEIHKGRKHPILDALDKVTGYTFEIKPIPNKKAETIIDVFNQPCYKNLDPKLVFTDEAKMYPKVVEIRFPSAEHINCLVHMLKLINKSLKICVNDQKFFLNELRDHHNKLKQLKKKKKKLNYKYKKAMQQFTYHFNKRDDYRKKRGIKPYQLNSNKRYPILKKFNKDVAKKRARLKILKPKVDEINKKTKDQSDLIKNITEFQDREWGRRMYFHKLYHEFIDVTYSSVDKFFIKLNKLKNKVQNLPEDELTIELMQQFEKLFGLKNYYLSDPECTIKPNYLNTNRAESRNSEIRLILDRLRNISDTPYFQALFGLIKLKFNVSVPYNNPHKKLSPIEELGYNLKNRDLFNLLLEGLPPGKQPHFNLGEKYPLVENWGGFIHEEMN